MASMYRKFGLSAGTPSEQRIATVQLPVEQIHKVPLSKAYELQILKEEEHNFNLEVPCHQYIYNVGKKNCIIKIEDKFEERFESGDSIYLKPYLKHKFYNTGKLLILRIGGKISGEINHRDKNNKQEEFKDLKVLK